MDDAVLIPIAGIVGLPILAVRSSLARMDANRRASPAAQRGSARAPGVGDRLHRDRDGAHPRFIAPDHGTSGRARARTNRTRNGARA